MEIRHKIFSIESDNPHKPEYLVMAVTYDEEDLDDLGVDRTSWDFSEDYFGRDEYSKILAQWKDPTLLREFYDGNIKFLSDSYWHNISKNRFVLDVTSSVINIVHDFKQSCSNQELYSHFEPLSKRDESIRTRNESTNKHRILKLKAKYGLILDRIAFRIYAIEIEQNCYLITGGAIKLVKEMGDAPNTDLELRKLKYVEDALDAAGICSMATLLDYINY